MFALCLYLLTVQNVDVFPSIHHQFQVAFKPNACALNSQGKLLLANDQELHLFSSEGELENLRQEPHGVAALVAWDEGFLVQFKEGGLLFLEADLKERWRVRMQDGLWPPQSFDGHIVLGLAAGVHLLDNQTGRVIQGWFGTQPLENFFIYQDTITLQMEGQKTVWLPYSQGESTGKPLIRDAITYFSSHDVQAVAVTRGGDAIFLNKKKVLWKKKLYAELIANPLYLENGKRGDWLLASKGRTLSILNSRGGEVNHLRLPDRPSRVLTNGAGVFVQFVSLAKIGYLDSTTRKLNYLDTASHMIDASSSLNWAVFIGYDGQIIQFQDLTHPTGGTP